MERPSTGPVLVTGGTGFIGSHLVELLLDRGQEVTCLVRDPERTRWLRGLPVRILRGDCMQPDSLAAAVRGAAVVYHVAGLTKAFRPQDFYEVNQQGTRNLLEACAANASDLRKFVLVSSLAAAGPGVGGRPVTDRDTAHPVTDYGRSKLMAEEETLRFKDRFAVVIVRPSAVYGPRDTDVFELFRWAAKGFLIDLAGGKRYLQWCYVGDLADLLVLAGEREVRSGSIYFAAEDRVYSTAESHEALLRSGGVSARIITVPVGMGHLIGAVSELAGRLRGRAPIMNRQKVREAVQQYWTCDLGRTRAELGFSARVPLDEGFARTWTWYRTEQWIR
jgi:nucleoside-diphosphate-sugar epimerase